MPYRERYQHAQRLGSFSGVPGKQQMIMGPIPMTETRRNLSDHLDALVSDIVRDWDRWCVDCGRPETGLQITHAHIFPRDNMSVRFDPNNGVTLCFTCHRWYHDHPVQFKVWIISLIGREKYDSLEHQSRAIEDHPEWKLKDLYLELTKRDGTG